jgi:hypothetical protein
VTWGRWLYFPSEGRHAVDFFTRLGLNPWSWVPEASMITTRPPKPLWIGKRWLIYMIQPDNTSRLIHRKIQRLQHNILRLCVSYTYLLHTAKSLRSWPVFAASQEIPCIFMEPESSVLTSAHHPYLSWANSIQSSRPPPTSWRSILIMCFRTQFNYVHKEHKHKLKTRICYGLNYVLVHWKGFKIHIYYVPFHILYIYMWETWTEHIQCVWKVAVHLGYNT